MAAPNTLISSTGVENAWASASISWVICASSEMASVLPGAAASRCCWRFSRRIRIGLTMSLIFLSPIERDRVDQLAAGHPGEDLGVLAVRAGGLHVEVAEVTHRRGRDAAGRLATA